MFSWPLPILGRPLLWYGFFFALGFFFAYLLFIHQTRRLLDFSKRQGGQLAGSISSWVIFGTLIGARLGDVLFYQGPKVFFHDPLVIFRFWEGGLASHGGAIGIIVALLLFQKFSVYRLSMPRLLDLLALPTFVAGAFIRIGNFFNQEIVGKVSSAPWAVFFGRPAGGEMPLPRHPVQLYEAVTYLALAVLLYRVKKKKEGWLGGLFLISLFTARFFLEFFKERQSVVLSADFPFSMGQLLSIPFILLGIYLAKPLRVLPIKGK